MLNQTSNQYYPACLVDHLKVQNNLYNFTIICIVRVCTWHITDMGISWTAVHGVLPKLSKLRDSHKLRSHTETWRFYVADIHYISQNLSTLAVHIMRGKQSRAELLVGTGCIFRAQWDECQYGLCTVGHGLPLLVLLSLEHTNTGEEILIKMPHG